MRIFGQPEAFGRLREDDEDAPALVLTEATLVAAPGDLRAIARFLEYAADQLETWGPGFDHEHFWDWVDGLARVKDAYRLIIERTGREPGRDELAARAGLTREAVGNLIAADVWPRLMRQAPGTADSVVGSLTALVERPTDRGDQPDVIVSTPA